MELNAFFVAVATVLSVAGALHLWLRAPGSAFRKLRWSAVLLVPFFGPLFYAGFYRVPSAQPEGLQASESIDVPVDPP